MFFIPLLLVAIIAVACGEDATPTPTTAPPTPTATTAAPTPTPTPVPPAFVTSKTKTLVIAAGPPNWETLLPWASGHIDYKRPLFEFLGGLDRLTGEKQPELATEFSLSPDAVTWTIKLQQGVQFHFG